MATCLQIEGLTKSYGDRMLFADVTFGIDEGDKIALIAKNGMGKSTMLRIIAGEESPDSGRITARSGLSVAYLPQHPSFAEGLVTMADVVDDAASRSPRDDAAELRTRLVGILHRLGLADPALRVASMSGGERKRLALAIAIASEPRLLILDEPTNHLDIEAVEWLEGYLGRSRIALLLVTHDRYFLDRVCNKIVELDRERIFIVEGNYDTYLRRRSERIEAMGAELDRVRNTLRREQEWMSRQPQARAGKAKFRIDAFHDLKERSRIDLRERNVTLDVRSSRIGSKIFEAVGLTKSFGSRKVLDGFTYTFAPREKIGIIGPNGVGKSTFIKMLMGLVPPDSGSLEVGETVRFGHYSQEGIAFDESKRVVDAVTELAEDVVVNGTLHYTPMQFLQRFLFSPADQQKPIAKLSGGERRRLHLACVLMRSPNFLILDEPTNDLDIVTLSLLEEYLRQFEGCVIAVSHDRFFLDSIADHLFVFTGDGSVKDFPGTYSEYRAWQRERDAAARSEQPAAAPQPPASRQARERPRRLSFKEQREMQALEAEIEALSREKSELEAAFSGGQAPADMQQASRRYAEVSALLDEKELRWLELSEIPT